MSRRRARPNLYKWVAISVAVHVVILLLLPTHIFQFIFQRNRAALSGSPKDLTPDFAEVAIAILRAPTVPVAEIPADEFEEIEEVEDVPLPTGVPSATPQQIGGGEGRPGGEGAVGVEAVFFPARPRLIVPPSLEDLEIASLRVDLKILVGPTGIPEEVVLPDSLSGREIGRRLLESARRFRFEPARKGDLPVASWVDLPLLLESSPRK